MAPSRLTADDVEWGVNELARRLDERSVNADFAIVGAAAILLRDSRDRESTMDVDTWIACAPADRAVVDDVIAEIAAERRWPADWLNDKIATAGFIPENVVRDRDFHTVAEKGSVRIHAATAELLFAMKLRAGRGNRDLPDLDLLAPLVPVRSAEHARKIYEARYPEDPLKATSERWVQQYFTQNRDSARS